MRLYNDIVSDRKKGITDNKIIAKMIDDDSFSEQKLEMLKGQKYFLGKHDVLDINFAECMINGKHKINPNRSNYKITHPFHQLLVRQKVAFIAGNPILISCNDEDKQFDEYLSDYFMFDFDDTVVQWITETSNKGTAFLHIYYDNDAEEGNELKYAVIPSEQIIPIYKDEFGKRLVQVIRYYKIKIVNNDGKIVERYKAEWWTDETVTYYVQDENDDFVLDEDYPVNPSPHWFTLNTARSTIAKANGWGKVPFVELKNNDFKTNDLSNIKDKIDAYDIVESESVNQIADVREVLVKIMGYSGTKIDEIMDAFRVHGAVKIDDKSGNVDILKTEIPTEARKIQLERLERSIYKCGMGVNLDTESFGGNTSGVGLKFLYENLNLKCNVTIRKLNRALYEFIWFVVDDYNRKNNANINYRNIKFSITKSMLINEAEIIKSLGDSKGLISDKTIVEKHPYAENDELERVENQEKEEYNNYSNDIANKAMEKRQYLKDEETIEEDKE